MDYNLDVKLPEVDRLKDGVVNLENVFERVIAELTRRMAPDDYLRFVLQSNELAAPISLPFMPVSELSSERIMYEVERVLQSHEQLHSNQTFDVNLIHVSRPRGAKGKHIINMRKRLQEKHCLIPIVNKDELCMARCIVVGVAKWENDPAYQDSKERETVAKNESMGVTSTSWSGIKSLWRGGNKTISDCVTGLSTCHCECSPL